MPVSIRFHDLRHSCATLLLAQGVPLVVVRDTLGHTQISTTADVYGHVLPHTHREAVAGLDALLGGNADADEATDTDKDVDDDDDLDDDDATPMI
jgi:integrase